MSKLLPMLCAVLRHRLSTPAPRSTVLEDVYTQQLISVVDGSEGEELCSCLLPLYDRRASLTEARQLTVEALSLLLASSKIAKRTSLDSEGTLGVRREGVGEVGVEMPPSSPQVVWWSHVW